MTSTESQLSAQNGTAVARAVGNAVFDADTTLIRQFAAKLAEHAQKLRSLTGDPLDRVEDSLNQEAQAFTVDGKAPPIYGGTAEALAATTSRFKSNLISLAEQLDGDAGSLTWLADKIENDQEALAAAIRDSDSSGNGGTGGDASPFGATGTPSLKELEDRIGADVGVAYMPLFGDDREVTTVGNLQSGDGWSTMKSPVVLAALRENGGQVTEDMRLAITSSDNDAANRVWATLGTPQEAAQKVQDVLRSANDTTTVVNADRDPNRATAFGQTQWSLGNQLKFMEYLNSSQEGAPLRALMSQVEDGQRWGLGQADASMFKGGWGPDTTGQYTTRQMGIVEGPGGPYAVAIMVSPRAGGDFNASTQDMTQVSEWLKLP